MKILAFGEVLFDVYADAEKLGGAPLNFCAHLSKLGADGYMLSAIGKDRRGEAVLQTAEGFGVHTDYVGISSEYPTGICQVTYQGNEPNYDLSQRSAYDFITADDLEAIKKEQFDVFYFGTLAQRNDVSRSTLITILDNIRFETVFFDMNLRQHYYSEEMVKEGLRRSDIVKVNREEFSYLKSILAFSDSDTESFLKKLCETYNLKTVILTLDKDGAVVYDREKGIFSAPCAKSRVVSTVGAGDSFCACFLLHYLNGAPIPLALEKAGLLAAYVVSVEEAIPEYPKKLAEQLC